MIQDDDYSQPNFNTANSQNSLSTPVYVSPPSVSDIDWYNQPILEDNEETEIRGTAANSLLAAQESVGKGIGNEFLCFDAQDDNGVENEVFMDDMTEIKQEEEEEENERANKRQRIREYKLKQNLVEMVTRLEDSAEKIKSLKEEAETLRKRNVDLEKRALFAERRGGGGELLLNIKTLGDKPLEEYDFVSS